MKIKALVSSFCCESSEKKNVQSFLWGNLFTYFGFFSLYLLLKLKNIIGSSKKKISIDGTEVGVHISFQPHSYRVMSACSALRFTDCLQKPVEEGEQVNTTLQAYFFGKKGENKLQYQEFRRWFQLYFQNGVLSIILQPPSRTNVRGARHGTENGY